MKSRTIEIIDNHIKALEEELEWYQKKNIEWQEKYDEKQQYIIGGNLDNCFRITTADELLAENARLRDQLRWHSVDEKPRFYQDSNFVSEEVLLKTSHVVVVWYRYDTDTWHSRGVGNIHVPHYAKWCYIPEGGDE